MVKYALLTLLLLLSPLVFPINNVNITNEQIENYIIAQDKRIIETLKTKELYFNRDLKEIDSIASIYVSRNMEDSLVELLNMDKQLLVDIVVTVSIAEGSKVNRKGALPFKSSLFLQGNNPFGIKGTEQVVSTVEYLKGKRTVIIDGFKYYDSYREAINDFLYLLYRRYGNSFKTPEDVFYAMKNGGYFTHPTYETNLLKIYKKIK